MATRKPPAAVAPLRQYAEDTKVPVSKTKQDIEQLLMKRGATQFGTGYDKDNSAAMVLFTLDDGDDKPKLQIRIMLPVSGDGTDQKSRAAWRALWLSLKAKLISIDQGISTMENAFFADIILPNGQTMAEHYAPQITAAYATNRMPALLPGLGTKG